MDKKGQKVRPWAEAILCRLCGSAVNCFVASPVNDACRCLPNGTASVAEAYRRQRLACSSHHRLDVAAAMS